MFLHNCSGGDSVWMHLLRLDVIYQMVFRGLLLLLLDKFQIFKYKYINIYYKIYRYKNWV